MKSGAGGLADEVIRADDGLVSLISQVFTAENRSVITAARAQLMSFADQLRAAWPPLFEQLMPLARNIAAVLSARLRRRLRSAADRGWLQALRGADPVHLGDHHRRELGQRFGRAPSRAWVRAAPNRQGSRSEHAGDWRAERRFCCRFLTSGRGLGSRTALALAVSRSRLRGSEISFGTPPLASLRPALGSARLRR
jgi:hypothetical protein